MKYKITAISDIHGDFEYLDQKYVSKMKNGDLFLICGDSVPLKAQRNLPQCKSWFSKRFPKYRDNILKKMDHIVIIGGNHDFIFNAQTITENIDMLNYGLAVKKVVYLQDSEFLYKKSPNDDYLKIYGSPWCPPIGNGNWAFLRSREVLDADFSRIPNDVDILMTHTPPHISNFGIVSQSGYFTENYGSIELDSAIVNKSPKYLLCGHVHSGNHKMEPIEGHYGVTQCANVSFLDEDYKPAYEPLAFEIEK